MISGSVKNETMEDYLQYRDALGQKCVSGENARWMRNFIQRKWTSGDGRTQNEEATQNRPPGENRRDEEEARSTTREKKERRD